MNRILKSILCLGVCGTMLLGAAGCNKKPDGPKQHDTEKRILNLSTGKLDGNFNPFFYTAGNDGNMISNTQIGMLTLNESGRLVAGQNYPTAVLDFKKTMYDSHGNVSASGATDGKTEYEFVIKNGIKFSNGEELTIADVLFNLYVYLDPVYTGSNTIYSTEIVGLKAYRAQDLSAEESDADFDEQFVSAARLRIKALVDWSNGDTSTVDESDLEKVRTALKKELTTDWNMLYSSWSDTYKDTYRFTEAWQAYLYENGIIEDQTRRLSNGNVIRYYEDKNSNGVRDDGELYYTTIDEWQPGAIGAPSNGNTPRDQELIDKIAEVKASATGDVSADDAVRDYCIQRVYDSLSSKSEIANVLTFRSTAGTILEQFTNEARSEYIQDQKDQGKGVDSISGITTQTVSGSTLNSQFKGDMGEKFDNDQTYSVLKIQIYGVDPKAIYNFSYTVAPLSYYSTDNYKGKHYISEALAGEGFGLEMGNTDFFEEVLQASGKVGLPVGAGPYMAADNDGNPTDNRNKFYSGSMVNFVRNENFKTLGTGISNAKIKRVRFNEIQDDMIMTSIVRKAIDFGMPNATTTNNTTLNNNKAFLGSANYYTNGYGYVGVNPKFVPEVTVRQALMKAMDASDAVSFYGTQFATAINRPMTLNSWAYPRGIGPYEGKSNNPLDNGVEYTSIDEEITRLVEMAGYERPGGTGVYTKVRNVDGMHNAPMGSTLKLSFTIAGETTEHPAYRMFCNTRDRLNQLGFDINVKTSVTALQQLATGNLAVWAAAWSSAIDPDPYQVYHKDSRATSVLNWNYRNILNNESEWTYEAPIINDLSELIESGRQTNLENERTEIYHDCLDMIISLYVEFPLYQRRDLCVYNTEVIDANSLVKEPSFTIGLFDKLWEIDYV